MVRIFEDSLREVLQQSSSDLQFSVHLYITGSSGNDKDFTNLPAKVVRGRPDFSHMYEDFLQELASPDGSVLARLCAPEAMDTSAAMAARKLDRIVYESELFVM